MKLKYYLRGLAVGVLLTTIVLTIANAGKKPLTDAQIRQRALALGMIEIDSVRLSALQGESTSPPESGSLDDMPESNVPESGSESNTPESGTSAETAHSPEKEDNSSEASTQPDISSEPETSPEQNVPLGQDVPSGQDVSLGQDVPSGSDAEPVTFQVKSGAGSSSVSQDLAAAGLIEDAAAFDTFLCDNGYSKRIRAGTYKIVPGTSEEDIAKIITQQS